MTGPKALGRAGAYSLELATPALCQSLGAISGESGPLSRAAGLCTQNLSLSLPSDQPHSAAPHRGLAPPCRTHGPRLPRPC